MSLRSLAFALVAACLAGCGESESKSTVSVTGTITFSDGKPLPTGTRLMFNPAEGLTETAVAVTGPDGAFEARRSSGKKGVMVGKYTILLRAPEGSNGDFFRIIPKDYYDGGVLDADVKEGMPPLKLQVKLGKR
jgi:hypothetical protein